MSIERVFNCDGPDCGDSNAEGNPVHVKTATEDENYLPPGFIEAREQENGWDFVNHFCSWDCLLKFAAKQPVVERIDLDD